MKNKLTERLEIRLTPKMKKYAMRMSKRQDISVGEVFRTGLMQLKIKEEEK